MTIDKAQMTREIELDAKAMKAARKAVIEVWPNDYGVLAEAAVRAYCDAAPSPAQAEREACKAIALEHAATCDADGQEADAWIALQIAEAIDARTKQGIADHG